MGRPQKHERDGTGGAQRAGWEGTGQAPPNQNSKTASGTKKKITKCKIKKVEVWIWTHWAGAD